MSDPPGSAVNAAFKRLMSLQDGDRGVLDVVRLGRSAIPALRALLFKREPSGLYQPRCHVVEALAALGGEDVLIEFLKNSQPTRDPVENAGDEAVLNAAALHLHIHGDEHVFQLLLRLAETRLLPGPITVLGECRRQEALPCLIRALEDDIARPAAEAAVRKFAAGAQGALLRAARDPQPCRIMETESSHRRRRAALSLLLELGDKAQVPSAEASALMSDEDHMIAILGCRLVLDERMDQERHTAVWRLIGLLPMVQWPARREIEACLARHPDVAATMIAALNKAPMPEVYDLSPQAGTRRSIRSIAARLDLAHDAK